MKLKWQLYRDVHIKHNYFHDTCLFCITYNNLQSFLLVDYCLVQHLISNTALREYEPDTSCSPSNPKNAHYNRAQHPGSQYVWNKSILVFAWSVVKHVRTRKMKGKYWWLSFPRPNISKQNKRFILAKKNLKIYAMKKQINMWQILTRWLKKYTLTQENQKVECNEPSLVMDLSLL